MEKNYEGLAVGIFEMDNLVACYVALDAATKAAAVFVQGVERNRLKSGACVKLRGRVSDVRAAMDAGLAAAAAYGNVTHQSVIASPAEGTDLALQMTIGK